MAFITLDFETFYGTGYTLKSLTYEQYLRDPRFKVHVLGLKVNDEKTQWVAGRQIKELLHDTFTQDNDHVLIAHNTLFDGAILSWIYGLRAAKYWCTQAMSRALWNQQKHDLGSLAKRLWPDDPNMRKGTELVNSKDKYTLTEEELLELAGYCVQDVDLDFAALREMYPFMPDDEMEILDMTLQMFIHPALVLDRPLVRAHLDSLQEDQHHIITQVGVPRSTLSSTTKLAKYIKDRFDLEVPRIESPTAKNPDNMKYAFAKNELVCLDFYRDHPQVQQILDARFNVSSTQEQSRAHRFLDHSQAVGVGKPDGIIAVPLNYAAAHTLRFGGANKVNGQNLGRKSPLRKSLKSPEGFQLVIVDQANIESRMLAWFAGETAMLKMYAEKQDIYSIYASKIYGRPVDRKREVIDANGKVTKPDYIEGHVGKTAVLGLGYGMGPPKFRNTLAQGALGGPPVYFSVEECHNIVHNVYRASNPNVVATWAEAQHMIALMLTLQPEQEYPWRGLVVEHKRIRLPNGLYLNYPGLRVLETGDSRPSYEYWQGDYYTNLYGAKCVENIIQALARIVMTTQMLDIHRTLLSRNDGGRVILTVHDEVIAIATNDMAEACYHMMLEKMRIPPPWCNDGTLVLEAEGGFDDHYSK